MFTKSELLIFPLFQRVNRVTWGCYPKSEGKVLAEVGAKDVYNMSSADRTQITILACCSASGYVLPTMHVFPGERFKYNPLHESVPNTFLGRTKNGWMDTELFYMWLANHFVVHIPPARPVILLVDGHSTHIDIQITKFCQGNQIILYCLPAHTSHIVQPLDVAFFRPLKVNWRKAVKAYKDDNPGQTVTKQVFAKVFHSAWEASVKAETFINGFRDSGLYPFNPQAVDAKKFSPALIFGVEDADSPSRTIMDTSGGLVDVDPEETNVEPAEDTASSTVMATIGASADDCSTAMEVIVTSADIPPTAMEVIGMSGDDSLTAMETMTTPGDDQPMETMGIAGDAGKQTGEVVPFVTVAHHFRNISGHYILPKAISLWKCAETTDTKRSEWKTDGNISRTKRNSKG